MKNSNRKYPKKKDYSKNVVNSPGLINAHVQSAKIKAESCPQQTPPNLVSIPLVSGFRASLRSHWNENETETETMKAQYPV